MKVYIKLKGYDNYYKVDVSSVRRSLKSYLVVDVLDCDEISKYAYYKANKNLRFIIGKFPRARLHELDRDCYDLLKFVIDTEGKLY